MTDHSTLPCHPDTSAGVQCRSSGLRGLALSLICRPFPSGFFQRNMGRLGILHLTALVWVSLCSRSSCGQMCVTASLDGFFLLPSPFPTGTRRLAQQTPERDCVPRKPSKCSLQTPPPGNSFHLQENIPQITEKWVKRSCEGEVV